MSLADIPPSQQPSITDWLTGIEEPRIPKMITYPLHEIVFIVFVGTLCGLYDIDDIVYFAEEEKNLSWFREWFEFKNGIPTASTVRRVLSLINNETFEQAFNTWVSYWSKKGMLAIDGKCLRGTSEGEPHDALYTVNVFSHEEGLVLGQRTVDSKSNEITAIPELLDQLSLEGNVVTMDAMGTQTKIVGLIRERKADYVLALKGNQGTLHKDVVHFFENKKLSKKYLTHETLDFGHGRVEERTIKVTEDIACLKRIHPDWKDLRSIVCLVARRTDKKTGRTSEETRYYISSLEADPVLLLKAIRGHWGIENQLHWPLDVTFREDDSRLRRDNTAPNMALIRKIAYNVLKRSPLKKPMKTKTLKALMSPEYRTELISHS